MVYFHSNAGLLCDLFIFVDLQLVFMLLYDSPNLVVFGFQLWAIGGQQQLNLCCVALHCVAER